MVAGILLVVGPRGASQRPQSLGSAVEEAWDAVLAPVAVNYVNYTVLDKQVGWATCVIDVHQAIFYLAQVGTFIKFATLDCPNATKREDKLACAADISVAINSFFWTASYVAATINSCQVTQSVDAACIASLNGVIAELGEFAFVATSVVEVCEFDDEKKSDYWHYKEYYDKKHGIGQKEEAEKYNDKKDYDKKELDAKHHDEKYQSKPHSAPPAKTAPKFPSPSEAKKFIAESAAKVKDTVEKFREGKQLQAEGKMEHPEPGKGAAKRQLKKLEEHGEANDRTKSAAPGHGKKHEHRDDQKAPKALERLADAADWMEPKAFGHQKKPEGRDGGKKPKAPEHQTERGSAGDRTKAAALGQQQKPEGHRGPTNPKAPEHQTELGNTGDWMKSPAWGQHEVQKKSKAPEHQAGVFDWMQPPALGHLGKQEGPDGHSKPKLPEHPNGQGASMDWMKLAASGSQKKQEQHADLTKAWEGLKHLKDGMDGMKVAAWLEHMKEEHEEAMEKYAVQKKKSERKSGGKEEEEEEEEDGEDGEEVEDPHRRGARITQCLIDVNLGLSFLARAGLQIYALTKNCHVYEKDDRKTCAIDIFNVIASFAWGAQFLAQIAVDCPEVGRQGAACAAVVSDFVAIIAALGPLVNGITDDCPYYYGRNKGVLPPGYADFFGASQK